jgi:hypothetical protein
VGAGREQLRRQVPLGPRPGRALADAGWTREEQGFGHLWVGQFPTYQAAKASVEAIVGPLASIPYCECCGPRLNIMEWAS